MPVHDPPLAAYVTLTAILVATPGSSTAIVVRHALRGGRAAGVATAAGIAVANTAWATAAGLGVTALLTRAPLVFAAIQFGGAAYLALLGMRALTRAWQAAPEPAFRADDETTEPDVRSAFRDGVAVNLLNPPIATFYLVVVPSFLRADAPPARFVLLAAIHVGMAFVCHTLWATGFDVLRGAWSRPTARRSVEAAVGIALLALAVRMLR